MLDHKILSQDRFLKLYDRFKSCVDVNWLILPSVEVPSGRVCYQRSYSI